MRMIVFGGPYWGPLILGKLAALLLLFEFHVSTGWFHEDPELQDLSEKASTPKS